MNPLEQWVPLYVHNPVLYLFCKKKEGKENPFLDARTENVFPFSQRNVPPLDELSNGVVC